MLSVPLSSRSVMHSLSLFSIISLLRAGILHVDIVL